MRQQGHEFLLAAIGLRQVIPTLLLGCLGLAIGEVVHHAGEGTDLLTFVKQWCDGSRTPKSSAVLPHLPAQTGRMSVSLRAFEFMLRLAAADVFRRKEL